MKRTIVAHYHEINLKGNNRPWFENRLQQHVSSLLKDVKHEVIQRFGGRLLIGLAPDSPIEEISRRLRMVFGIANFAVAWEVEAELEAIQEGLKRLIAMTRFQSFKIDTRRGTKEFRLNSQQLNQQLGAYVQGLTGARVAMENPDAVFSVELVRGRVFLSLEKIP
ncbi:MAG TPA: THUMP domain-containing protein, partial [Acidobacteriota bacterium]|nr:THUMP domain-containing protein [Acidobacteriota bacterium]